MLKLITYCVKAVHAVNAVLWQPGEQTQNYKQTNQTTTIPMAARAPRVMRRELQGSADAARRLLVYR